MLKLDNRPTQRYRQNEGRSCRVWIERYGGGGKLLSHVSAIACERNQGI